MLIYGFVDSWIERLLTSLVVSIVNLGHVIHFVKEHMFLNSSRRMLAFRQNPSEFIVIPIWLSEGISIVTMLGSLLLAFIMYKLFWG